MARLALRALVTVLPLCVAGCSNLKPYPNELATKNLNIRTVTSASSMFSSLRAEIDVHSVDAACGTQYLGTVALDVPSVDLGVPAGRRSRLVFHFVSSNFLGSSRGRISREVELHPRADQRYEIDVTYRDDLYDVTVRERQRGGTLREQQAVDLSPCRS